ncbi:cytochrome P450 [Enhygromyxa salina]|nr:cytochrome P450 [Enhygromyxa salina]
MPPPRTNGPILGNALALLRDPLAFLRAAHVEQGPIFEVHAATRRFVVLAGREANRFVGREGRELLESRSFWGRLTERRECPHAILASDGVPHRTQRKHYADVLSRKIVDAQRDGCDALIRDSFGASERQLSPRVAVQDQTRLLIARLVHRCLTDGAAPIPEPTARALMEVFRWETNTLLLGKWPKLALLAPAYRRSLARAEGFIDELVARDLEAGGRATDQADQADQGLGGWFERIRQGRERYPELFTAGDVRFATLLPFVAGVDTVGATLGFVLYELFRDADLHAAVRAEVEAAYANGVPDSATLSQQPTLHGLVLECLRLYPAAFAMYRGAARAFEFAGHRVAAGTEIAVFTSATHFDARYFPEPERLDVTRHAPPRSESRQKHVFMPYGGGPHVCLGAGMGEAMLLLATAGIVRHHDLVLADPKRRWKPSFDPSLTLDARVQLLRPGVA